MAVATPAELHEILVDILTTERDDATGSILAQTGDVLTQEVDGQGAVWTQHVGFASRPSKAVAGDAACQGVLIERSNAKVCVASRDLRGQQLAGNLLDGESCVYAGGADGNGQARAIFKADGSVVVYTTDDNTPTGKSVSLVVAGDGLLFVAPWGVLEFSKANGFKTSHQSGAQIAAGPVSGLPAPFDAVTSQVSMSAAVVHCKGALTLLGAGPAFAQCATGLVTGPLTTTCVGTGKVLIAIP